MREKIEREDESLQTIDSDPEVIRDVSPGKNLTRPVQITTGGVTKLGPSIKTRALKC